MVLQEEKAIQYDRDPNGRTVGKAGPKQRMEIRFVLQQVLRGTRNEKRAKMERRGGDLSAWKTSKGKRTYSLALKSSDGTGNHAEIPTASVGV